MSSPELAGAGGGEPVPSAADRTWARRRARRWQELVIVVAIAAAGGFIGTQALRSFVAAGFRPFFYQLWFGAAVMDACGHGYRDPEVPGLPQSLRDFLDVKVDRFACADLPPDFAPAPPSWFQRLYRYLELTVALVWRLRGVSWHSLDVVYAAMSGAVAALAYGIIRLGAGRVIAAGGALALASSPLNLIALTTLRDYAKAPFQMALILVMGCLVLYGTTRRRVVALAALGGAVLGIGLGFRPDVLLAIVPVAIVLAAFLPLPLRSTLGLRAGAMGLFLVAMSITGAPILAAYGSGSNTPHVMLLGFADPFTEALGLRPAQYSILPLYSDRSAEFTLRSAVVRRRGGSGFVTMSSKEYDDEMTGYLRRVVREVPGDVIVRAYAAVLKIFETPAAWEATQHCEHFAGGFRRFCGGRMSVLSNVLPVAAPGMLLVLAGLILANPRVGLFTLLLVCFYLGGAAIQFDQRHYFYLELMPWVGLTLVLQRLVDAARRRGWRRRPQGGAPHRPWRPAGAVVLAAVMIAAVLGLGAARLYQAHRIARLAAAYLAAPTAPLTVRWHTIAPGRTRAEMEIDALALDSDWHRRSMAMAFLRADFSAAACGYALVAPLLRYQAPNQYDDLSASLRVELPRTGAVVSAFFPAYAGYLGVPSGGAPYDTTRFSGIELTEDQAACLVDVRLVTGARQLPLIWYFVAHPERAAPRYYQRLVRWEPAAAGPHLYSMGAAGLAERDLIAPVVDLRAAVAQTAPTVTVESGDRIVVDGAPSPDGLLVASAPQAVPQGTRAIVRGRLDRGGIVVTLSTAAGFLDPTTITAPGDFAIAAETPAAGGYQIVILNHDGRAHGTQAEIYRLGWLPPAPPTDGAGR